MIATPHDVIRAWRDPAVNIGALCDVTDTAQAAVRPDKLFHQHFDFRCRSADAPPPAPALCLRNNSA
jgi:hypothetical protein